MLKRSSAMKILSPPTSEPRAGIISLLLKMRSWYPTTTPTTPSSGVTATATQSPHQGYALTPSLLQGPRLPGDPRKWRHSHGRYLLRAAREDGAPVPGQSRVRRKVLLLMDNMRPHHVKVTQLKLEELKIDQIPHPPYSPDISPCDFHAFLSLEMLCRGQEFKTLKDLEDALADCMWDTDGEVLEGRVRTTAGTMDGDCAQLEKVLRRAPERLNCSYFDLSTNRFCVETYVTLIQLSLNIFPSPDRLIASTPQGIFNLTISR